MIINEINQFPLWNLEATKKSLSYAPKDEALFTNMEEFENNFEIIERLEECGVERGQNNENERKIEIQIKQLETEKDYPKILEQLSIMGKVQKQKQIKNILKLQGMAINENSCQLYYESGDCSLDDLLNQGATYKQEEILWLMKEIGATLAIAENFSIAHQNICTQSIVYCQKDNCYKIGNWASACLVQFPGKYINTGSVGSHVYCTCELFDVETDGQVHYSPFKGDIFALGLVGLRMCGITEEKILEAKGSKEWNVANFGVLFKTVEKTHGKVSKILAQMLNRNAAIRPSWVIVCEMLNDVEQASQNMESYLPVVTVAQYLNGSYLYYKRKEFEKCVILSEKGVKFIEEINEPTEQIKEFKVQLKYFKGLSLKDKNDFPQSLEEFLQLKQIYEEFATESGRTLQSYPFCLKRIGQLYCEMCESEKAVEFYNLSIENLKKVFNESNIEIAKIYYEQQNFICKIYFKEWG